MKLIYKGKTKDVFDNGDGNFLLQFKDDVTGADGKFDPGANTVGLTIEGVGKSGIRLTEFFFKKIEEAGIPTHFVSADVEKAQMIVRPATMFGKGLEVICRLKAVGSFLRRFGDYCTYGQDLDFLVETTLKDDERGDPPITKDQLDMLGILTKEEYEILKDLTQKITHIIKAELAKKGMELYDIKFEFGRVGGKIMLIDEISGGSMRVFKEGKSVEPLEISAILFGSK
jgi:phosphoribosylaminoimidazole-succinocarboxamide synthase